MSDPVALDSSCWIEVIEHGPHADAIRTVIHGTRVVVPTTCVFEVYRWCLRTFEDVEIADDIVDGMEDQIVVPMDADIATRAAVTAVTTGLCFADATILAAARSCFAHLYTLDADFEGLEGVTVLNT